MTWVRHRLKALSWTLLTAARPAHPEATVEAIPALDRHTLGW